MKNYLMICEIGPIHDFTKISRKTADFWGASFLFSYIMARVAAAISDSGGNLFLPYLKDNPLYLTAKGTPKGDVYCGSVPDQIYAVVPEDKKETISKGVKDTVGIVIEEITNKIKSHLSVHKLDVNKKELADFFNLFFIFHEMDDRHTPDYERDFIPAEEKIKMRGLFRPFMQEPNPQSIKKWDKCSLCGDRKKVHDVKVDNTTEAKQYNQEHICGVCLLKRYLPKIADKIHKNIKKPSYESTSDIAAVPIIENLNALKKDAEVLKIDELLQEEYSALTKDFEQEKGEKGRCFFETRMGKTLTEFRNTYKAEAEKAKLKPTSWLTRPFYTVVYMDGDNLGSVLKENNSEFEKYITSISKTLSAFANSVYDIINNTYHGQLIFAGGEDVVFMIHPEYLLDCIAKLNDKYQSLFDRSVLNETTIQKKLTLSAGAFVCYHKYPLSQAISGAAEMLFGCAKEHTGKNATAVKLIKGHSEALSFKISNKRIPDMIKLKKYLEEAHISRTTPYRIRSQAPLFEQLGSETALKKSYLASILAGTRGAGRSESKIEELTDTLMNFDDIETMVDAMLYARFLLGDKQ